MTPQTKAQDMQIGAMQLMVLIFVFREHPCHDPELIRRPAHTSVSSVSREPTQLCNLRYVRVFICLY